MSGQGRDSEVVRRGLRAGLATWAAVGGLLVAGTILAGGSGRVGLVGVLMGLVAGTVVTAGWLLLAGILDLLAGQRLTRRRLAWTLGSALLAVASPVLVAAAAGA